MGDTKKAKKMFQRPQKPWDKERIKEENELKKLYGLKNKREIWRAKTILKSKRQSARRLLSIPLEQRQVRKQELIGNLTRIGLLNQGAILEDVFTLSTRDILERRLQTLVWRRGLANTAKQARQFITHGKIQINGRKTTIPSFIVTKQMEESITYYGKPPQLEIKTLKDKKPKEKKENVHDLKKEFEEVKGEIEDKPEEAKVKEIKIEQKEEGTKNE